MRARRRIGCAAGRVEPGGHRHAERPRRGDRRQPRRRRRPWLRPRRGSRGPEPRRTRADLRQRPAQEPGQPADAHLGDELGPPPQRPDLSDHGVVLDLRRGRVALPGRHSRRHLRGGARSRTRGVPPLPRLHPVAGRRRRPRDSQHVLGDPRHHGQPRAPAPAAGRRRLPGAENAGRRPGAHRRLRARDRHGADAPVGRSPPDLRPAPVVIEPDWVDISGRIGTSRTRRCGSRPMPTRCCSAAQPDAELAARGHRRRRSAPRDPRPPRRQRGGGQRHRLGPGVKDTSILFQPFRENADGSGLGLYISRTLVRTFGGDLRHVQTDAGCRFDVILPCEPAEGSAA